jgi:hypothetical protein
MEPTFKPRVGYLARSDPVPNAESLWVKTWVCPSSSQCPLGVNRVVLAVYQRLPVYPDKQTISDAGQTSRLANC